MTIGHLSDFSLQPEGMRDRFVPKRGFRLMQLSMYFAVKVGPMRFD
jgi:hypothetical protein